MAVDPKLVGGGAAVVAIGGGSGYAISQAVSSSETTQRQTTIKEKIEVEWLLNTEDTSNDQEFKELTAKLKTHSESPNLNADLKTIKGKTDTDAWGELKNWCKKTYKATYEENSDLWNLANKFCKKPTIKDKLGASQEVENTDAKWTAKVASAVSGTKNKELKDSINTGDQSAKNTNLKNWCKAQYPKVYDSKFTNSEDSQAYTFLSEVEKWCIVLIKDKLDSDKKDKLEGESKETEWKAQAEKLKSHKDTGNDGFDLPENLKTIKTNASNDTNIWSKLKTWCTSAYERPFKGDSDLEFRASQKFCQKD